MNPTIPSILQRQSLRLRLQTQRLIISQLLITDEYPERADGYPRSMTMRVLTRMPGITSFLLTDVAPFLVARFLGRSHNKAQF